MSDKARHFYASRDKEYHKTPDLMQAYADQENMELKVEIECLNETLAAQRRTFKSHAIRISEDYTTINSLKTEIKNLVGALEGIRRSDYEIEIMGGEPDIIWSDNKEDGNWVLFALIKDILSEHTANK